MALATAADTYLKFRSPKEIEDEREERAAIESEGAATHNSEAASANANEDAPPRQAVCELPAIEAGKTLRSKLGDSVSFGWAPYANAILRPRKWTWQDIFEASDSVEISGPPGGGKTTLATLLAVALANPTGIPVSVLGREVTPIPEGRFVVFVERESSEDTMGRKWALACSVLGLPLEQTMARIASIVQQEDVRLRQSKWEGLLASADAGEIGATFIDSRARVLCSDDGNSESQQAEIANEVTKLVKRSGGPVVVLSHTVKGGKLDNIDAISGSAQRGAGVDTVLTVEPNRKSREFPQQVTSATLRVLKVRGRDPLDDDYPRPVTYSFEKDENGCPRIVTSAGIDAESATSEVAPLADRIVALVNQNPDGLSRTKIAGDLKMLGRASGILENELNHLVAREQLKRVKKKASNGRLCDHYQPNATPRPAAHQHPPRFVPRCSVSDSAPNSAPRIATQQQRAEKKPKNSAPNSAPRIIAPDARPATHHILSPLRGEEVGSGAASDVDVPNHLGGLE